MQPLDPLQRVWVDLEDRVNVNTHQIVVLEGHLDVPRLREALHRTVRGIELVTSGVSGDGAHLRRGSWAPEDVPLRHHVFPGDVTFASAPLRQELMRLTREHPIRWRERPPMQAFYLTDDTGARSVLLVNCHHGSVDARANELLLRRWIRAYADLPRDAGPAPGSHRYVSYREIERGARAPRGAGVAAFTMLLDLARDLMTRGRGIRWSVSPATGDGVDFASRELDRETDAVIREVARRSGHTINSLMAAALYRVAERSRAGRPARVTITCPVSLAGLVEERYGQSFQNLVVPWSLTLGPRYPGSRELLGAIAGQVAGIKRGGIFTRVDRLRWVSRVPAPIRSWLIRRAGGSNACYANPGVIGETLDVFGVPEHPILEYASFGCLVPPHDFILYTPEFRGRLHVDVIFRREALADVDAELLGPLREAIGAMAGEISRSGR